MTTKEAVEIAKKIMEKGCESDLWMVLNTFISIAERVDEERILEVSKTYRT